MSLRRSRPLAALALVLVSLVAAGCGDSDQIDVPPDGPIAKWDKPVGVFADHPRGVLILIHGGGWKGIDRTQFNATLQQTPIYNRYGYYTMTIDYRAGAEGLADLERFYKEARERVKDKLPICAVGSSAGGHLALMLATREPSLDCAVSIAGPTNLAGLAEQEGGEETTRIAAGAFGQENLRRLSPALQADNVKARLFVVGADNDPLMPVEQLDDIKEAVPSTQTVLLPAGDSPWVHSSVDPEAKEQMNLDLIAFLNEVAPTELPVG